MSVLFPRMRLWCYRSAARFNPDRYLPKAAALELRLASHESWRGGSEAALALAQHATEVWRQLYDSSGRGVHGAGLADALSTTAECHRLVGRHDDALATVDEAIEVCERLADNGDDGELEWAVTIYRKALLLDAIDRRSEALPLAQEAVARLRLLAEAPAASGTVVIAWADALGALGMQLGRYGRHEEAAALYEDAVAGYRRVRGRRKGTAQYKLAAVQVRLAHQYLALGRPQDAMRMTDEATPVLYATERLRPSAHGYFGALLMVVVGCQVALDDHQRARRAAEQGVTWYRRRAASDSRQLPSLADALRILAEVLSDIESHGEAVDALYEAVAILRPLMEAAPGAHHSEFSSVLFHLGNELLKLGRTDESCEITGERLAVLRRLTDASTDHEPRLASCLHIYAVRLGIAGRTDEALSAYREAVDLARGLAGSSPTEYEPTLAGYLYDLANHLDDSGDHDAARVLGEEAAEVWRRVTETSPDDSAAASLVATLVDLSVFHTRLGNDDEALAVITEAVEVCRRLAETDTAQRERLAFALHHQSRCLYDHDRHHEALAAIDEAIALRRALARDDPAEENALADVLRRRVDILECLDTDHGDERLAGRREAVDLVRRRAAGDPDKYELKLADCLLDLAYELAEVGDHEAACAAGEEATDIQRRHAEADPDDGDIAVELARTLEKLSDDYDSHGDHGQALAAIDEATALRRTLARTDPAEEIWLARALRRRATVLVDLERHQEALDTTAEATAILRRYASDDRDHAYRLAMCLSTAATCHAAVGHTDEALAAGQEAVDIVRRLAADDRDEYELALAWHLHQVAISLAEAGDQDNACVIGEEAAEIQRRHAETDPDDDDNAAELAATLSNLSRDYRSLGNVDRALTVLDEAVVVYRQLTETDADHRGDLDQALIDKFVYLCDLERLPDALTAVDEIIAFRRPFADTDDIWEILLARALRSRAVVLSPLERHQEALDTIDEQTAAFRRHFSDDSDYAFDLAFCLYGAARCHVAAGHADEARAAYEEANLVRRSATADPAGLERPLARYLLDLALQLSKACDYDAALAISEEAEEIQRRHAEADPDDSTLAALADTLLILAEQHHSLRNYDRALVVIDEAVALRRTLDGGNATREILLADTLHLRADLLTHLDRHSEALDVVDEPTTIFRRHVATNPALAHRLALCLRTAVQCHVAAHHTSEAVSALLELHRLAASEGDADTHALVGEVVDEIRCTAPDIHHAFMSQRGKVTPRTSPEP